MSEIAAAARAGAAEAPAKPSLQTWWTLVKTAFSSWIDDYAPSMGAALSYYTVFSLAPLLLIVVSVAGLVFGDEAVRGELFSQLQGLMGADAAKAVQDLLVSVNKPTQGIVGTIVGVALLVFGATTVFGELQDALDRIWRAPAREGSGLWALLRARLLSFGMILGLAFLLMVSLVLGAAISALGKWWGPAFGGWETLLQIVNLLVGFGLTTVVFAMIYKMMPRVKVQWHDVWLGAVVTSLLFTIGKFLIGLYIGKSGVASGFGAAGSLIVVFIWVYYSAQIFLLGAEFTWVYAKTLGSLRSAEGVDEVAKKAAGTDEIPARSEAPKAPTPAAPAPSGPAGARDRPAAAANGATIADIGAGLAFFIALRFVIPRLLRRL
ncbi:MAG: YihY/virulence factor BrkB family protein [Caldimonas sp.]